jgi:hypothetical protein
VKRGNSRTVPPKVRTSLVQRIWETRELLLTELIELPIAFQVLSATWPIRFGPRGGFRRGLLEAFQPFQASLFQDGPRRSSGKLADLRDYGFSCHRHGNTTQRPTVRRNAGIRVGLPVFCAVAQARVLCIFALQSYCGNQFTYARTRMGSNLVRWAT